MSDNTKTSQRKRRHLRVKSRIDDNKPRLVVFRSLNHIYAQIIDDQNSKTLASASDLDLKGKKSKKEKAREVGKLLAKKATEAQIDTCVFDRAGYRYHGRVKELADGAREGGLKF